MEGRPIALAGCEGRLGGGIGPRIVQTTNLSTQLMCQWCGLG